MECEFDDQYLLRLRAGHRETEEHFYGYFRPRVLMKLRKGVHPGSEAEDVCQKVLLTAYAAIRDGKGPEQGVKLPAWIFGMTRNLVFEWYRAQNHRPEQFDPDDPGGYDVASKENLELDRINLEIVEAVRNTIASMEPRDADILTAVFLDERKRPEICEEYGIERSHLRLLLHRALQRFKTIYRKAG